MIHIYEQYGFLIKDRCFPELGDKCRDKLSIDNHYEQRVKRKDGQKLCYEIYFDKNDKDFHFQTSYFVGVDWVDIDKDLKIHVQPKLNKESLEVDYIGMLLEALQEPENFKHLDDLVYIDFHKPYIPITQKQDLLSPFLIAQFLQILKRIVRKGLKKSYYTVTENLNARVKGKILVGRNIKENLVKGRQTHTICQYQEFGVNCDENKILKKAYLFSRRVIQEYEKGVDSQPLLQLISYIHPAFESVSEEIDIRKVKAFKANPLFKEYDQAINLALLILKRFSYNITNTEQEQIMTPPFWIDMSKLFELYVYKKLTCIFSSGEVKYHIKAKHQELDFVLKSHRNEMLFVVDTKYKPRYHDHNISIEDIRQVSGYARLERVYKELSISDYKQNINCLILYSHQDCDEHLELEHFDYDEKNDVKKIRKEKGYVYFYKLGIKLPEIKTI